MTRSRAAPRFAQTLALGWLAGLALFACQVTIERAVPGRPCDQNDPNQECLPDEVCQDGRCRAKDGGLDRDSGPLPDAEPAVDGGSAADRDSGPSPDAEPAFDGGSGADAGAPRGDGGQGPALAWLSGAFGDSAVDGKLAQWRGTPVTIAGVWSDSTPDDQEQLWSLQRSAWQSWTGALDVAVGAIYKDYAACPDRADQRTYPKETWKEAAEGAYDSRWKASLTKLKKLRSAAGMGTTYIRFAAGFNGYWPGMTCLWSVGGSELAEFKAAWKNFRDIQKQIFPEAKLVWSPTDGTGTGIDVRDAFPDCANCVDVIGVMARNEYPFAATAEEFTKTWNTDARGVEQGSNAPRGVETWRRFAEGKGLPFALCEWGSRAKDDGFDSGGGDSPAYFLGVHDWLVANAGTGSGKIEYELLFNLFQDFALYPADGSQSLQPNAAAKYRELW